MCQFEKLRRTILYHQKRDPAAYVNYPIPETASAFEFSDVAFREILTGLANAGFIELNFESDACAQVRLRSSVGQVRAGASM
jgi:hypothetical protein